MPGSPPQAGGGWPARALSRWGCPIGNVRAASRPVGYLTYPIWTFYNLPSKTAQDLSYDAALLLIVFLLLLIIVGRLITWFARRHSESN